MKPVAPPRVDDCEAFWTERPEAPSQRLLYWIEQIRAGWRPCRRIRRMGYYESAEFYGVWIWEYLDILSPLLATWDVPPIDGETQRWLGVDLPALRFRVPALGRPWTTPA